MEVHGRIPVDGGDGSQDQVFAAGTRNGNFTGKGATKNRTHEKSSAGKGAERQ